jgi:hypothetical protein
MTTTILASGRLGPGDRILRFVQSSDGRGLRGLSGRKIIGSASIPMPKAGGSVQVESGPELRSFMRDTFDIDVVRVASQPVRAEGVSRGEAFRYIVDKAVLRADGSRTLVEIKGSRSQLRDPRKQERLEITAEAAAARGWGFEVEFADEPKHPPHVQCVVDANVDHMFPARFVVVTERHKAVAAALLRDAGGETTLGELAAVLDPNPARGNAVAYAMLGRRLVDIDLTRRLSPRSAVRSVRPLPIAMPPLRF